MRDILRSVFLLPILLFLAAPPPALAQQPDEKRIALVIGNAGYQAGKLATPANDAGLVAPDLAGCRLLTWSVPAISTRIAAAGLQGLPRESLVLRTQHGRVHLSELLRPAARG